MVQLIQEKRKPSTSQKFAQAFGNLGQAAGQAIPEYFSQKQRQELDKQAIEAGKQILGVDLSGFDPETRKALLVEGLKQQGKQGILEQKQGFLSNLFGGQPDQREPSSMNQIQQEQQSPLSQNQFDPSQVSDADIARATSMDPALGRELRAAKDSAIKQRENLQKRERAQFESERSFQTGFSKDAEKQAEELRTSIPKKEYALNFARDAVETGDLGYFSPDKLADVTGVDLFRTAKGAQLVTAGKENLLSNMGRVSARAQNLWFEQRLNSMFPKIGQSKEANLTVQEMLEGELALDKAYLNEFDRLSQQDEEDYGFVKKDISKRARSAVKPLEKEILNRTSYRMKEIEEVEQGLSTLKKQVGKNVSKGTPLTLAMAKLYKDKFGDNALKVAEKNGYHIPTLEEFKTYRSVPSEFREELAR